jgi:drug/metabolite transporter (DMT)-like permease
MSRQALGVTFATITSLAWGGQFVVGKSALESVRAFQLTTIRYLVAGALLVLVLVLVEGRRSVRLEGRGRRLVFLATLGFAGFNLLAYTGLEHAEPQSAALIVALGPLLTALVLWQRTGRRPTAATFAALGVALVGVALVISGGHPSSLLEGAIGWGDLLVLAGVLCFVFYTLGASEFPTFSALRFTALTAALGWPAIALATLVVTLAGLEPGPSLAAAWSVWPQIAYITLLGAVVAVLCWNSAVGLIGPQNTALFGNLIPIVTFAIEIARGYRPSEVEVVGALMTVGALVTANVLARRSPAEPSRPEPVEPGRALPEAT